MISRFLYYLQNNLNWYNWCCIGRNKFSIEKKKPNNNVFLNYTNNQSDYRYLDENKLKII